MFRHDRYAILTNIFHSEFKDTQSIMKIEKGVIIWVKNDQISLGVIHGNLRSFLLKFEFSAKQHIFATLTTDHMT